MQENCKFNDEFNKEKMSKVLVLGLGYIGLPTAAIIADNGYQVLGVDKNTDIVNKVNAGNVHINEPSLESIVKKSVSKGSLKASNYPEPADIYVICVPTPFINDDKIPKPDISHVIDAIQSIIPILKKTDIVIIESTCPPGTTKLVSDLISKKFKDGEINIAYCPERVIPGNILKELINNDRIVGGLNKESSELVAKFYKTFVKGSVLTTTHESAELCKLAENSFRDINIAFANELASICEERNIDVWEVIKLSNQHPRVNILKPGIGVGGHCIAIDPWFIVNADKKNAQIIKSARLINDNRTKIVFDRIMKNIRENFISKKIRPKVACFGLTYKPDVDDTRESPSIKIIDRLIKEGIDVCVVDPNVDKLNDYNFKTITEALNISDVCVLLVAHKEFADETVKAIFKKKHTIDFCNII